ncbi:ATP-dependent Clp protease ATP-binding subunit CLPT1, chloroplastic-like [Senna tora]|uniref:ATP-dependent Clp protease ATP-binding subunit CLPT1, chloroplastic-like n=1 Tax=Senna tora TaxID=362788 RepID=A0A834T3U5_9FABA|nr:ATP-dependent Clp protease ATP-binding subunit CLPT1, chloroplastic-like [Senna tora]
MAATPTLSSSLPAISLHAASSQKPNQHLLPCSLTLSSLFGTRLTIRTSTSCRFLPNSKYCRATSATVSFSLPTTWSARAIKSFAMAELEARKLKYPNTGTEALLMGILVEGTSKASKFLRANGITLFKVREETVELLGKSDLYFFSPEHPPLTEPAQKSIDWAVEEKLKSGEGGEITVTHLLLGIWSQKESAGHSILASLGFNDEKAKEVAESLNGDVDLSFKKQA